MPYILRRRFTLTATVYKYLIIGINVGPMFFVELLLGDIKDNPILYNVADVHHKMWILKN